MHTPNQDHLDPYLFSKESGDSSIHNILSYLQLPWSCAWTHLPIYLLLTPHPVCPLPRGHSILGWLR